MSTNKTPARKLTRAERKQIDAAIARAKRQDKRKKSAQDSIPFQRMYPDGVCRVTDNYYTKTVQFQDINYQLNQNEDKTAIFDGWCDFLNYFDSSIRFQLSFINLSATRDTYARRIAIPLQGDCFDKLRTEYTGMLQSQLARGNNGLIKTKYLTFGVEADSLRAAKPRLERIETDILNNFRRLGVQAEALNGMERLRLLHGMLHMDEPQPFRFSWDWLAPSGLSVKDFIAPSAFEFKTGSSFGVGSKTGCVSFLQILAPELNDRMLADFLDMESSLIVSMHVQSVDQVKAIKTIKRKITDLQKMTIEEQKKAVRSGYDMDIIPSDLATYGTEAKKLLQELQSRNERMFLLTFLVVNVADNRQRLGNNVFQAGSIAQKYNCQLTRLDFQQEEGFMSALPLGYNQIEIQRGLTTSSVAIFVPFTTQELFQDGKEALYCGLNALSNNLIMVDRKLLKNPNGLILGTPGSFFVRHKKGFLIAGGVAAAILLLMTCISSCSTLFQGGVSGIASSTYPLEDADMLAAEAAYCAMEDELREYLNSYESTHDYDEYHFDLDEIEHDPYVLISMITALKGGEWTIDEIGGILETLFEKQYILTETVATETRYRTETHIGYYTDENGNLQSYEYEAEVPYTWYICHVELENFNLSHVPVHIMSHDQLSMYAVYMSVLGNRPDLFPGSPYVNRYYYTKYEKYEIPPEALADEQFAAIIKEAEKYLGYPYVWGGSSPATSFDCSGFVSYVYNNCGLHWSFGRLGAEGLRGMCAYVSPESARPGDLIFFEKTYDTAGASHVGIYVGNNRMLHCGDPIHYASIDTSYWRSHFLQFGRLP